MSEVSIVGETTSTYYSQIRELKVYSGNEPYIFVSYSHRDTDRVLPVISRLMAEGFRVWYDSGIDPGTEWDENIAQHINGCGYFVAFLSENYLSSNNCKDELNYARDLEKERLIVYLEQVDLPSGMAMRINRLQSVFKYAYESQEDFYQKLFTTNNIDICRNSENTAGVQESTDFVPQKPQHISPSKPENKSQPQPPAYETEQEKRKRQQEEVYERARNDREYRNRLIASGVCLSTVGMLLCFAAVMMNSISVLATIQYVVGILLLVWSFKALGYIKDKKIWLIIPSISTVLAFGFLIVFLVMGG